ncbi:vomeronasal type-2 receptor 26-like [Pelobates cultripes]|uniref:Vomeronasal type-2 receptor 26-like n=1 Tax=Pelobates cultripes TaxID=61616 RepID=A0AAD1R5C0_PELCU|nr:vomeronasal type-2 receptor 26-like [Pelobates cultripes]
MLETDTLTRPTQMTKSNLNEALNALSTKLVTTWKHTANSLHKDIQELGKQLSHMEDKCDELSTVQNDLATNVEHQATKLDIMESKLADIEDRVCRNNLRLRGAQEDVLPVSLPAYVRGLFHAYVPEIPVDILLIDRVHRIPKPQHLLASLPRDVLLCAHYFLFLFYKAFDRLHWGFLTTVV